MELKFKTIYKNELIDCHVETKNKFVIDNTGKMIGRYGIDSNPILNELPILKVYTRTGYVDKYNNYIVEGHILKVNIYIYCCEASVVWRENRAGFYFYFKGLSPKYHRLDSQALNYEKIKIIGHVDLKKVEA